MKFLLLPLLTMGLSTTYSGAIIFVSYVNLIFSTTVSFPQLEVIAAPPNTSPTAPSFPVVKEFTEGAAWLGQQQISVWFAILTILFGLLIFFIIKYLLTAIEAMRTDHATQMKQQRDGFDKLQMEEKALSLQLLQYLEKDHSQTVVLLKENQSIMQENITLLRSIQQDRHDAKLLREKNHELLTKIDNKTPTT